MSLKIAELICPQDPSFHDCNTVPKEDGKSFDSLKNNLCKLAFFGNQETSIISQSIIAASLKQDNADQLLKDEYENFKAVKSKGVQIAKGKLTMGWEKINFLRKTFKLLAEGQNIPKHNYTFRTDPSKVVSIIEYLQEKLQFKPGRMRNVTIADHIFTNLPIYERGGLSLESMLTA